MNLSVEIRNNETGEIAKDLWKNWDWHEYWWEEGNASCDCNRMLFFCRALGLEEPMEAMCGDGGYSVRLSDADTGELLYSDFEGRHEGA